ncbi:MAG: hypothetical protein WAM28_04375 [Chlamydiales bacterium]
MPGHNSDLPDVDVLEYRHMKFEDPSGPEATTHEDLLNRVIDYKMLLDLIKNPNLFEQNKDFSSPPKKELIKGAIYVLKPEDGNTENIKNMTETMATALINQTVHDMLSQLKDLQKLAKRD